MGASNTKAPLEEAERVLVHWGLKWHATSSVVSDTAREKHARVRTGALPADPAAAAAAAAAPPPARVP